jgi:D-amino-acid oxidase
MGRVLVVGAGVVGLTCAVRLLEAGHRVDVVARDLPLETTSAIAAGLVLPHRIGPADRVAAWTARSEQVYADLAADGDVEAHGVRTASGTVVGEGEREAPLVDLPTFLPWLVGRIEALGGTVTRLNLSALPAPGGELDAVVNCSGLGARLLGGDRGVVPAAGQVLYVDLPGLDRWCVDPGDGTDPTYVVPRRHDVVVGGTHAEGEWSRTPSPAVAEAIVARAARLVPEVSTARVLRHKVGLRPQRPTVRLERVGRVVHCYGHGGAGVTVAWGCAEEVTRLVAEPPTA